jgi:hypothetical protein
MVILGKVGESRCGIALGDTVAFGHLDFQVRLLDIHGLGQNCYLFVPFALHELV